VPKKEQAASNAAAADGIADFTDFPNACKAYVAIYRTARDVKLNLGSPPLPTAARAQRAAMLPPRRQQR
jgi:hypothetical protein